METKEPVRANIPVKLETRPEPAPVKGTKMDRTEPDRTEPDATGLEPGRAGVDKIESERDNSIF